MDTKDITKGKEILLKYKATKLLTSQKGLRNVYDESDVIEAMKEYHQSQSTQITDNSKVNINLLKENEALRDRIKELEKTKQAYKECFEQFLPTEYWDEAILFLSTYGSGLAKDLSNREK